MSAKKPKPIKLQLTGSKTRNIHLTGWPRRKGRGLPYLWLGNSTDCFGVVADRDVKRLKVWCERILAERKKLEVG